MSNFNVYLNHRWTSSKDMYLQMRLWHIGAIILANAMLETLNKLINIPLDKQIHYIIPMSCNKNFTTDSYHLYSTIGDVYLAYC